MKTIWTGTLKKMRVEASAPVAYFVRDGCFDPAQRESELHLNAHLGQPLTLRYLGEINCIYCGRETKKTFGQGFCFPCFRARAEADICIVKPELCHYHQADDPCRDEQFAQSQCFQPHVLYCSLTSGVKVGITRAPNVPSRWIDQGATAAIPVAVLPSRREVGLVEKQLVDAGFADKTHWTRMLKGDADAGDLPQRAAHTAATLADWQVAGILADDQRTLHTFTYPVLAYPAKIKSLNLDRAEEVGGRLQGIKGQYLIFDSGVINLRKFSGYRVALLA